MIAVLFYNDSPLVRELFPTVYHWVGFILGVVVPAAFAVDRMVLHPSEVTYNAHQNSRENRNPGFRVTKENLRKLESVEEELDDIQRRLDAISYPDSRDYLEVVDGGRPELSPADISDERGDQRAP